MKPLPSEAAFLQLGPGQVLVGEGPFTGVPEPPERGCAFYWNDFDLSDPMPWKVPASFSTVPDLSGWETGAPPQIAWHPPRREPFAAAFEAATRGFENGAALEKLVPFITEDGRLLSGDPRTLAHQAMSRSGSFTHSYGRWKGEEGLVGVTPERFLSIRGHSLETMALAGTAPPQDSERFAHDPKQIREHGLVVEGIRRILGPGVKEDPREVLQLDGVHHFLTRLRLDLESSPDLNELIRRLHPTPAVGFLPRSPAVSALHERIRSQLNPPAAFAAPFGCWFDGRFESVIAIRHVSWHGAEVFLPAGCGLIRESDPDLEWNELALKREVVKQSLDV